MKFKGFTLAEVLVTIGIVGVVATMTMPALVSKYRTVEYTARIKKSYNTVSVAINEYLRVKMADRLTQTPFVNNVYDLASVLRVVTSSSYYYGLTKHYLELNTLAENSYTGSIALLGNTFDDYGNGGYFLLTDGTVLSFSKPSNVNSTQDAAVIRYLAIDTNGPKKPNQFGRDIFFYEVRNNGYVEPMTKSQSLGYDSSGGNLGYSQDCFAGGRGVSCGMKLMDEGWEMNY